MISTGEFILVKENGINPGLLLFSDKLFLEYNLFIDNP